MKKFLTNLTIFLIITYIISWLSDIYITRVFQGSTYYKPLWANKIKGESFDFAVLGNSRVYNIVDVAKIQEESGIKGINLGLDGSNFASQYLMLQIFFNNDNVTKKVLLQVDPVVYSAIGHDNFASYNFLPLLTKGYVFNHFKELDHSYYFYKYIPLVKYAAFNFKWSFENLLKTNLGRWDPPFDHTGSYIHTDRNYHGDKLQKFGLSKRPEQNEYLLQIINFCNEKNIQLIFFTAPYIGYDEASEKVMETFGATINKLSLPYYNYHDLFTKKYDHFYDNNHINSKGVEILNKKIIHLLKENDHL